MNANIDLFVDRLRDAPDEGLKLLAATAAALRDDRPAPGEALAAGFLDDEPPVALGEDAADRALARIAAFEALDAPAASSTVKHVAGAASRSLGELLALPDPVREAAYDAIVDGGHFGFAGFGIRRMTLPMAGEGKVDLLRIEPGAGVASHDHEGDEFTLVLTGAFHDGHEVYRPGDINVGTPGFKHEPKALPGEVCYALAVSYGAAAFEGPVGLLQKLTGFGR
ncbi:MAG: cupin domain-containing protein [Caulobacter sp.]|nr:cupin domain-containing protein [Caulobacter sp.]